MQNKKKTKKKETRNYKMIIQKQKTCFYFNIIYKKSYEYFKSTKIKYPYVKKMQEHKIKTISHN